MGRQVLQALVGVQDLPLLIGVLVVDGCQAERRLERHLAVVFRNKCDKMRLCMNE